MSRAYRSRWHRIVDGRLQKFCRGCGEWKELEQLTKSKQGGVVGDGATRFATGWFASRGTIDLDMYRVVRTYPVRKQVKILASSEAEHQRWKAEAKRRGQTVTMLIRSAVNKEVGAWVDEQPNQKTAVG